MHAHTDDERRGKAIIGMPVYSIKEGKRLGDVTALLIDRADLRISAIRIGNQLAPGPTIAFSNVQLIGADAVLVDNAETLEQTLNPEEAKRLDASIVGREVVTAGGQRLGTVSGIWVNTSDGGIGTLRVRPDTGIVNRLSRFLRDDTLEIPRELVQALGADAVIVSNDVAAESASPQEQDKDQVSPAA